MVFTTSKSIIRRKMILIRKRIRKRNRTQMMRMRMRLGFRLYSVLRVRELSF